MNEIGLSHVTGSPVGTHTTTAAFAVFTKADVAVKAAGAANEACGSTRARIVVDARSRVPQLSFWIRTLTVSAADT